MLQWRTQLPDLVDAFLLFKAHGPHISQAEDSGRWHIEVINIESTYCIRNAGSVFQLTWRRSTRTSPIHTHAIHPFRISHIDTSWLHRCLSQSTTSHLLDPATCLLPTITTRTSALQLRRICEMPQPLPFSK